MQEIIDLDIDIKKSIVPKKKAIEYFQKNKEFEKVKNLSKKEMIRLIKSLKI